MPQMPVNLINTTSNPITKLFLPEHFSCPFVDFVAKKSLSRYPQALALVAAVLYSLPPGLVFEVPLHGFSQAGFEGFLGFPAQFLFDFAGVYSVAAVVAGAVLYVGDLVAVFGFFGHQV